MGRVLYKNHYQIEEKKDCYYASGQENNFNDKTEAFKY